MALYPDGYMFVRADQEASHAERARQQMLYKEKCTQILRLLDDCSSKAVSDAFWDLKALHPDLSRSFMACAEADDVVREDCRRESLELPLFVCHASDRILEREVFNPHLHVREQDLVLLTSSGQHSKGGWELARVETIRRGPEENETMLEVVYVLPSSLRSTALQAMRNGSRQPSWGPYDDWCDEPLLDWPLPGRGNVWSDTVSVDSVWWGCTPTKKKTIRKKSKDVQILKAQILRIEAAWKRLSRRDKDAGHRPCPPTIRSDYNTDPLTPYSSQVDDDE
jgi:hypothetical protein